MKTAGIIVEYNPFHNGHQLHLERTREKTGADFIVAVMSGNFVQRGAPALTDKYARAKMALLGGADLVLELPVLFATGSAGDFAAGAVSLLDKLGVVDFLCFGSEHGAIAPFLDAAALLAEEPQDFSLFLQKNLKQGLSFPLARSLALQSCLSCRQPVPCHTGHGAPCHAAHGASCPAAHSAPYHAAHNAPCHAAHSAPCPERAAQDTLPEGFLTAPNNILGVEYCTALAKRKSAVRPVTIQREGAGYHDGALFSENGSACSLSSATAIRRVLKETRANPALNAVAAALPAAQLPLWQEIISRGQLLFPEDFTKELRCRLILEAGNGFERYADVTRALSDKLKKNYLSFTDWDSLCETLKSKELTYSRISRALCHILLSITDRSLKDARSRDYVPYARILGFQKSAMPLLSAIKQNGSIPLISKLADASRLLPADALAMLQQDVSAAHLYESAAAARTAALPRNEYTRQICIL